MDRLRLHAQRQRLPARLRERTTHLSSDRHTVTEIIRFARRVEVREQRNGNMIRVRNTRHAIEPRAHNRRTHQLFATRHR
jgi:NMD protein affecting ribosome stability and mRNA decay